MTGKNRSAKKLIIFWIVAIMALFAWYNYLNGNILSSIITLSFAGGILLGIAIHPLERYFSGTKQAKENAAERSDLVEIKNNNHEPKIDKIDRRLFTPEEVKKRLNQLLQSKF